MDDRIDYENLASFNSKYKELMIEALSGIIEKGQFVLGDSLCKFERNFANYIYGAESGYGVGVNSGLDALTLAIKSLDLPRDSEVIVPSNTYIATVLAVVNSGLKPVLVEPNIDTYNIEAQGIKECISSKTKAVIVVHMYGKMCHMDLISDLCRECGLVLIEDCAQAHGSMYKGNKAGSYGIGCFSFYPTKNLGALGDGGFISTKDAVLYEKLKAVRNYGSNKKYYNIYTGYNSRLDNLQASFLDIKLKNLDEDLAHRRALASLYREKLTEKLIKPALEENCFDTYHIFNVRLRGRDLLKKFLLDNNIHADIHYPIPPHRQACMKNILRGSYPISDEIHNTTLSLPMSFGHDERRVSRVAEVVNIFMENRT